MKTQVAAFLKTFKSHVNRKGLHFVPRKQNLDGLARLGLTVADARNLILGLTEKNYVKGPEPDEDGTSGGIWVFDATYLGSLIYIKLKYDGTTAKCLSFHGAEFPLRFPYP